MAAADRKISEVMSELVTTIGADRTWEDAARKMCVKNIHHLVVLDQSRQPIGVVSTFDFLACALDREETLRNKTLAETHPKRPMISVKPGDTLAHAANLMSSHQVECLPVLNAEGFVAGIITPRDLMMAMFPE